VVDRFRRELASFARLGQKTGPDGFAVPAALLAALLIAALIAGAFSATTEETRIGAAAADRQTALTSAESAIEIAIKALTAAGGDTIGVGETKNGRIDGLGVPTVVYVTRLDSSLYWLVADAGSTSPNSGVARRIGVVVRATKPPGHSIGIDRIPERGWSELF
jgi:Tfp pilus assembly protein PilX